MIDRNLAARGETLAAFEGESEPSGERSCSFGDVPRISGKYAIVDLIGRGGMGEVYAARDLRSGDEVALKILRLELMLSAESIGRFQREAMNASSLKGAHAVRVLDVGSTDVGQPYIAMERLHGTDLEELLANHGALPIGEAVFWVVEACEAMEEAHARGIIHRDLKPSNLFLANTQNGTIIKLLDFGISKVHGADSSLTVSRTSIGTPAYMSPEQSLAAKDVDERTDVWALGVILYELLVGDHPFPGDSPTAVAINVCTATPRPPSSARPEIPAELEVAVLRALEKEREDRFASVRDFAEALRPFVTAPASFAVVSTLPSKLKQGDQGRELSGSHEVHEQLPEAPTAEHWPADAAPIISRQALAAAIFALAVLAGGVLAYAGLRTSSEAAAAPSSGSSTVLEATAALPPATMADRPAPASTSDPPSPIEALPVLSTSAKLKSAKKPSGARSAVPSSAPLPARARRPAFDERRSQP